MAKTRRHKQRGASRTQQRGAGYVTSQQFFDPEVLPPAAGAFAPRGRAAETRTQSAGAVPVFSQPVAWWPDIFSGRLFLRILRVASRPSKPVVRLNDD